MKVFYGMKIKNSALNLFICIFKLSYKKERLNSIILIHLTPFIIYLNRDYIDKVYQLDQVLTYIFSIFYDTRYFVGTLIL